MRTPQVVITCIGFLIGVASGSLAYAYGIVLTWWVVFGSGILLALAVYPLLRERRRIIVLLAVLAFAAGAARFLIATPPPQDLTRASGTFDGRVVRVAALSSGSTQVRVTDVVGLEQPVDVYVRGGTETRYGDVVRVRCVLRPPERLRDLLTIAGTCSAMSVRVLARGAGSPTLLLLDRLHARLAATNDRALIGAPRALVASAVLGDRGAVDRALTEAFRRTGTIHALVISGAHMTIIGMLLARLFRMLPLRRRTTIVWTIATLASFVAMVGATPSAVRGALMVTAFLAVELLGRVTSRIRILLLVATAMVLVHPHILAFDLGFELSFAAVAGILLLTPILERAVSASRTWVSELRGNIAASTAATLATAPLLLGAFGSVSILGILVNIPLLLILEGFLLAAIAFLMVGTLFPAIATVVAWPVAILGNAIAWLIEAAAALPWALVSGATFHWWFTVGIYVLGSLIVLRVYHKRGVRFLSPFLTHGVVVARMSGAVMVER